MRITNDASHNAHPIDGKQPEVLWTTSAPGTDPFWTDPMPGTTVWRQVATGHVQELLKVKDASLANDWVVLRGVIVETWSYSDFTDGGAALGTKALTNQYPAGAIADPITVRDVTGFAGNVSAVLTVGVAGGDVDAYSTGTPSVFASADFINIGVPSGQRHHTAAGTITLHVTASADYTAVNAGALTVVVPYHF